MADLDYRAIKTADAALDPPVPDPAEAAAVLNRTPVTRTGQPFRWRDAKRIARQAPTGDWSRIVARARMMPSLPPTTLTDQAILAAINAVESADDDLIDPGDAGAWAAFQGGIAALTGIGDLAAATVAALGALPTVTTQPFTDLQPTDVVAARNYE